MYSSYNSKTESKSLKLLLRIKNIPNSWDGFIPLNFKHLQHTFKHLLKIIKTIYYEKNNFNFYAIGRLVFYDCSNSN